jgi:hypothetical protein
MLSHQLNELSVHPVHRRAASLPPRDSALGQHYVAASNGYVIWLVSGPYPDRATVARHLERARAIACAHSPVGERLCWGGFHATDDESGVPGLIEGRLKYPAANRCLPSARTPMSDRQFSALSRGIRSRGFNCVLTHCGPVPIEKWRPVNVFWGLGAGLDPFCAGFDWVGANLVRSIPTEAGCSTIERVWTLGIEGPYAFVSPPLTVANKQWRITVLRDRRTTRFEWRRNPTRPWNLQEHWPTYSPRKTGLGLPDRVLALNDRHTDAIARVLLEDILQEWNETQLQGEWYDIHLEAGPLQGPIGPEERALQRWITRAKDVPGSPREQQQNFLAQRFTRDELLSFWDDVRHLRWPLHLSGAPWKTAQQMAFCVANNRMHEIGASYAEDLTPHILASLSRPVEDWARTFLPIRARTDHSRSASGAARAS